jgi:hypothetical protein
MRLGHMKKVFSAVNNTLKEVGATKNSVLAEFDSMMQEYVSLMMLMTKLVTLGLVTQQMRRSTAILPIRTKHD